MRRLAVACAIVMALAVGVPASVAFADGPSTAEQVETLSAEAAEAFNEEDYERAIDKFQQAYELQPVPNLLYNIGHTYEQLEEWDKAREYYDEFIRSPDVDSEARELALERVDAIREIQEVEAQEEVAHEDEPDEEPDEQIDDIEQPDMVPAYATLGAGVAMVGAGALTGIFASGNADRITDTDLAYDERRDAQSRARTQGLVADGFYVVGIVTTAVGGYLLFSATSTDADGGDDLAGKRSITPWIGTDHAGFGLHLDF